MNNLAIRSIAGIVFSIVVVGSAWLGPWALGTLFFLFAVVGLHEFYTIVRNEDEKSGNTAGMLLGIFTYLLFLLNAVGYVSSGAFILLGVAVSVLFCLELIRPSKGVVTSTAVSLMGIVYVVMPFGLLNTIAGITGTFEYEIPIGFFLILWVNDSGAYLFGKYFGKHKLYEKVSPNKTWEGLIAGILCTLLGGWIISKMFSSLTTEEWLIISALIAVFANLGDLFESQIKRVYGIKDSGHIIPGHGGVLDRFDGLFTALPAVAAYLYYLYN